MAEREGFEPPIPVKVWLISSQLHSTGLCHLSASPDGQTPRSLPRADAAYRLRSRPLLPSLHANRLHLWSEATCGARSGKHLDAVALSGPIPHAIRSAHLRILRSGECDSLAVSVYRADVYRGAARVPFTFDGECHRRYAVLLSARESAVRYTQYEPAGASAQRRAGGLVSHLAHLVVRSVSAPGSSPEPGVERREKQVVPA